jgi:hypothetical protein
LIDSPVSDCTDKTIAWYGLNVLVENLWITMTHGAASAFQDSEGDAIFTSDNNVFRDNHYCVSSVYHLNDGYTFGWFGWMNGWLGFSDWQD